MDSNLVAVSSAYNPHVDEIGDRVRRVRQQMGITGIQMAKYALGEDAREKDIRGYADRLSKLERGDAGHTNPSLDRLELLAKGMRLSLSEFIHQIENADWSRSSRQTDSDLHVRENPDRTAPPPEGSSRGRDAAPVPLDAHALLQAGNALVDAGGLFIAAAKGVEVRPRARARDTAGKRPAGQRRRAGGNR